MVSGTQRSVALVTGAGQGIGQAIELALAECGARVIATDLKPPQETARKIAPTATALQLAVTHEEDRRSASVTSRFTIDPWGPNSTLQMELANLSATRK